jgi:hypothetical protein
MIRTLVAASVAAWVVGSSLGIASELDGRPAPRALLVRVDSAGEAVVFRSDRYDSVTEENFETAIEETAVSANVIDRSLVETVKLTSERSELDVDTSRPAWYWWSYGNYWWGAGSWFTWNTYRYSWAYPCWYRGYSYYWYYGAW